MNPRSVAVIGAGLSGLLAARKLAAAGLSVVVLEKSRGLGGRMATRRIGGAVCDHGAQFFTVREEAFAAEVREWSEGGLVRPWYGGPGEAVSSHVHYICPAGMTAPAKHLANGLDVRRETRVTNLRRDRCWTLETAAGERLEADLLLCTAPLPQLLELLGGHLPETSRAALGGIDYDPCLAVMAVLERPSQVPAPGFVRPETGPLEWVADNRMKGLGELPALTLHAGFAFSREHWETDPEEVTRLLLASADPWLGGPVRSTSYHRWRYSKPCRTLDRLCWEQSALGLVLAGDAFGGPRVEGAALSGLAAAEALARMAASS